MKYLDATVFINAALPAKGRTKYKNFIEKIVLGKEKFATSVLTLDEVVYKIRREIGVDISKIEKENWLNICLL